MRFQLFSVFIATLMVMSLMTPFAYAQTAPQPVQSGKVLNLLTKFNAAGATCDSDVYVDKLDWTEYKSLQNRMIGQLDAFGNQALGKQESNAEAAGSGTNGDVIAAKNYYIPGVDGKPAILYDVMKKKVVDPTSTCHLNNFFSTGRIAYATRLADNIRYCALNDTSCEAGIPSTQQLNTIKAKIDALQAIANLYGIPVIGDAGFASLKQSFITLLSADPDIREAFIKSGYDPDKILTDDDLKEAIKNGIPGAISYLTSINAVPSSIVETESGDLTLSNADFLDLLPATRADFFDFMRDQKKLDQYMLLSSFASAGAGIKASGKSLKEIMSRKGLADILKNANTGGLRKVLGNIGNEKRVWNLGKDKNEVVDGLKTALAKGGDIEDLRVPASRVASYNDEVANSIKTEFWNKGVPVSGRMDTIDNFDREFVNSAGQRQNLRRIVESDPNFNTNPNNVDIKAALDKYVSEWKASASATPPIAGAPKGSPPSVIGGSQDALDKAVKNSADINAAINTPISPGSSKVLIGNLDVTVENTEKMQKAIAGAKPSLRELQIWKSIKDAKGVKAKVFTVEDKLGTFLSSIFTRGYSGQILTVFQKMNFWTAAAIWINNDRVVSPAYEIQAATFAIGKDRVTGDNLKNLARDNQQEHYLEISKTAGNVNLQKYAANIADQIFEAFGLPVQNSPIRSKITNIQDLVFIYDQDAAATGLNTKGSNVVSTPHKGSNGVNLWSFLSIFKDNAIVYNYEHPSGFIANKKTALFLDLHNINIGGILAQSSDNFNTPLTSVIGGMRFTRDLLRVAAMFSIFPAAGDLIGSSTGAAGAGVAGLILGLGPGKDVFLGDLYHVVNGGYGRLVDIKEVYKQKQIYCGTIFGQAEKNYINGMKAAIIATNGASIVLNAAKATPLVFVSIAVDIANMYLVYKESEKEQTIAEGLRQCVDTNFKGIAYKEFVPEKEVQDQFKQTFAPIKAEAFSVLGSIAPEISGQINNVAKSLSQQVLNINGEVSSNLVSANGKEVYYVNLKDADVRWFQGPTCKIDLCQIDANGDYRCDTQNGYFLLDENGEPILNGIPQALSARFSIPEDNFAFVQNVIEVKKKDSDFLKITPDGVKLTQGQICGESNIVTMMGITATDQATKDKAVKDAFGKLQNIYTKDAQIWFDGNEAVVQFSNEMTCSDGSHGVSEISRYTNGYVNLKRDNQGTVEIRNPDDSVVCSFSLGTDGAASFDNAMLRSGTRQTSGGKTVDYSDVFHLFINNMLKFDKGDLSSMDLVGLCTDELGANSGFKVALGLSADEAQANQLLQNICFTAIRGLNNESIQFKDGKACIKNAAGAEACHEIDRYDPTTGRIIFKDGFELSPSVGPDGVPQFQGYQNGRAVGAPIQMLLATGLGGAMMYNPGTGQISINNAFPLSINPGFSFFGAGGLGLMTPLPPPWGQTTKNTDGTGTPTSQPNILAQLPWTPTGLELIIFVVALLGALLFVRIRYRNQ